MAANGKVFFRKPFEIAAGLTDLKDLVGRDNKSKNGTHAHLADSFQLAGR